MTEDIGIVLRTAASEADDAAVEDDARALLDLAQAVMSEPASGKPEKLFDGPRAAVTRLS